MISNHRTLPAVGAISHNRENRVATSIARTIGERIFPCRASGSEATLREAKSFMRSTDAVPQLNMSPACGLGGVHREQLRRLLVAVTILSAHLVFIYR
jgi:hypothetical protein